ncbi:MAG: DUF6063 family protein [bacterium]|jgi:hypothetical protein|nr:hypothetical protein [Bacillota bacterium]
MQYSADTVTTALTLLRELLKEPVVNRDNNPSLMLRLQQDPDALNLWQEIMEPVFGLHLLRAGDEFYLTAGINDESVFNYSNAELRQELGLQNNTELYTCSFIILTLIAAIYSSDDSTGPAREYITVAELEGLVSHNFAVLTAAEDLERLEDETRMNIEEPAQFWADLPLQKVDAVRHRGTISCWAFLLKTLDFLARHQLVLLYDDRQVFPLPRLSSMVAHYYNHADRKNIILELLQSETDLPSAAGGDEDAAD